MAQRESCASLCFITPNRKTASRRSLSIGFSRRSIFGFDTRRKSPRPLLPNLTSQPPKRGPGLLRPLLRLVSKRRRPTQFRLLNVQTWAHPKVFRTAKGYLISEPPVSAIFWTRLQQSCRAFNQRPAFAGVGSKATGKFPRKKDRLLAVSP
jgi:hypothetical protein